MILFNVDGVSSYQKNTGLFKKKVLDVAISEINKFTEFEVTYKEMKEGRSIIGFDLDWSKGQNEAAASTKQIKELRTVVEAILEDQFNYINLKNDELREEAIGHIQKIHTYIEYTSDPICITSETANNALQNANWIFKRLETMKEQDKKPNVLLYNWLEERE